ncbi:hypothetical protein Trisim1_002359 [Trichoderma cf. simile WF8]
MTTPPVPGRQWRGKLNDVMYRVQMQRNLRKILEAYRIERWGATADRRPCASGGRVYDREPSKQEVEEQSIELRLRGFMFQWQR